jgi:O-antigen/teichoic acid export membrane protein
MIEQIKNILRKTGMDGAIFYTATGRIIQAGGAVVTILFIARFLSEAEQGYYYTFGSILAIQTFFELGLGGIIIQYVAHEAAHLKLKDNVFSGSSRYTSRLASLLHLFVKWYMVISLLLLCTLVVSGWIFFSEFETAGDAVGWRYPWYILCFGTALNLFISPLIAFIEGVGRVKDIALLRLIAQLTSLLSVLIVLYSDGRLYASGISALVYFIVSLVFLWKKGLFGIITGLWKQTGADKVSYRKEILPYQWRIALSWVSGYFIFHLFNPVLFAYSGPKIAGQMGMTLSALGGIQSLSLSWLNTKVPLYSKLIALKNYVELDGIFNKTLKQMLSVCFVLLTTLFICIFAIRQIGLKLGEGYLGDRFLDYIPMLLMMIPLFVNQFVNSWATYLRCHKQEPFLINSIVAGFLCCLSTLLLGKYMGVMGVTTGYCVITVALLPWGYWIYRTKKKEYHGQ